MAESIMQTPRPFLTRALAWWKHLHRPADPIGELMAERARMVQRGEFEPLGTILMLKSSAGWIQFPTRNGPALGRFADAVDLLDPWEWNGLPDRYEGSNDLCPNCAKAPCVECFPGDGLEINTASPDPEHPLPILAPGERLCCYGTQVEACGGMGVIVSQDDKDCPSCDGTGKVLCRKCLGTAMMCTGYQDWDNDLRRSPSGKLCESCGGSGRVRKIIPQDIMEHASPDVFPGIRYLPLVSFMLMTTDKRTQPWKCSLDSQGNLPEIVSAFASNARAIIVGGVLRPENPSRRRNRGD